MNKWGRILNDRKRAFQAEKIAVKYEFSTNGSNGRRVSKQGPSLFTRLCGCNSRVRPVVEVAVGVGGKGCRKYRRQFKGTCHRVTGCREGEAFSYKMFVDLLCVKDCLNYAEIQKMTKVGLELGVR